MLDSRDILPDPCDNRLIRSNNCIQLLACVCEIAAAFDKNLKDFVLVLDLVADCTFATIAGCMHAQTDLELKAGVNKPDWNAPLTAKAGAPSSQAMGRRMSDQESRSLVSHPGDPYQHRAGNAEC